MNVLINATVSDERAIDQGSTIKKPPLLYVG